MPQVFTRRLSTKTFNGQVSVNTGLFIDGQWVDAVEGGTIDVIDPTNGELITKIAGATAKDVDLAVKAADKAFKTSWGLNVSGTERARLLENLVHCIEKHADELAAIETIDCGKIFVYAKALDIATAVKILKYYVGWADKMQGRTMETEPGKFAFSIREPIGVCGLITPWNFPFMIAIAKMAPALATGNTVVFKPSEVTPLSAHKLGDLIIEAGFPPGVVNIVTGYGNSAGQAMSESMGIRKISFTGSTLTGRKIMEAASKSNLKRVGLELGGKTPAIIFDDADLQVAIQQNSLGVFFHSGQMCTASSRIFVQEGIYDTFMEEYKKASQIGQRGDAFDPETTRGPVVSEVQFKRVMGYIKAGKDAGATVFSGGDRDGAGGWYIQPTIFTNATPDMKISREEIFGPVTSVVKFKTEEEALAMANDTEYGLASCIYTNDLSRAIRFAGALDSGAVWVNSAAVGDERVPQSGTKISGHGYELGEASIDEYTTLKSVHVVLAKKK